MSGDPHREGGMTTSLSRSRRLVWFSCGAASAVAAKLTLIRDRNAVLVYCDTRAEHEDNARFRGDCERWLGQPVTIIGSDEYADTWDVWERRRYLAGINGAPCTVEMKVAPRLGFQRPHDIHVFGYTADAADIARAARFRENYPEILVETPLIDRGLTKAACLALLQSAGIAPPVTYSWGLPNANCLPCPKATSPAYWALIREREPAKFARMVKLSRELGVRLCRLGGRRAFIDEIPVNHPTTGAIAPACDFLCAAVEQDMDAAA